MNTSRRGRLLLPTLVALLGLAIAHAAPVAHHASVEHEVCDDHGLLAHADHDEGSEREHGPEEEHAHCSPELLGLETADVVVPAGAPSPLAALEAPALATATPAEPRAAAVYRLAPKTSPPAPA